MVPRNLSNLNLPNNNKSIQHHNNFDIKIGLEIHCQLTNLKTKLFCNCQSDYRDFHPNQNICQICLGLPGSLPLLNKRAIEFASMICIALNCKIPNKITFYRKNYFYPDLPKNFQITQFNSYELSSIGYDGFLSFLDDNYDGDINFDSETDEQKILGGNSVYIGKNSLIRIKRVQLEEDPGKIYYDDNASKINNYCLIDYNRAGVALVEIVTEPDFTDPSDVRYFLNKITNVFEYLGVSDPGLEGAIRCDVNVSIKGGKKVEIKNISSFKDVEKSIHYEITRQKTLFMHEIAVKSETRHWDEKRKITVSARSKEEEDEYRYFPEPDIPRIILGKDFKSIIKEIMPELPIERLKRYTTDHKISNHVSKILTNNKKISDFYEETLHLHNSPREISNWIVNELLSKTNEKGKKENLTTGDNDIESLFGIDVNPQQVADIVKLIEERSINRNIARDIFVKSIQTKESPFKIVEKQSFEKISDSEFISKTIREILDKEPNLIEESKTNKNVLNFILGKVMKNTNGRVDPQIALKIIRDLL